MHIKTGYYENAVGRVEFKKTGPVYMSKIDASGAGVEAQSEELIGAPGAVTMGLRARSRVIPASFQFADIGYPMDRDFLAAVFSPLMSGTLVLHGELDDYAIDCRPQEAPSFVRNSDIDYLWGFDVNFIADYPFFRRGGQRVATTSGTVFCKTVNGTPITIEYGAGKGGLFSLNGKSFTVKTNHSKAIVIDTKNMTIVDSDGNPAPEQIENFWQAPLESWGMNWGENQIIISGGDPVVRWYELALSVF